MKLSKFLIGITTIGLMSLTSIAHSQVEGSSNELANLKIHKNPIKVPNIEFIDHAGKKISNTNLIGSVSVINLWATWCPPCVKELPSIDRLAKIVKQDNVKIYAVSQDRAGNKIVPAYFQKLNLKNLVIYLDNPASLMAACKTPVLPTTIIIDKNGMEVARLVGGINWDSKEVVDFLKRITKEN